MGKPARDVDAVQRRLLTCAAIAGVGAEDVEEALVGLAIDLATSDPSDELESEDALMVAYFRLWWRTR